jgi:hypothetical protein
VSTHSALFTSDWQKLGMVEIDEQHKWVVFNTHTHTHTHTNTIECSDWRAAQVSSRVGQNHTYAYRVGQNPILYRVGQNRIYTPYMTVYLIVSLPKKTYVHRIYTVLANPLYIPCIYCTCGRGNTKYSVIYGVCIRFWPTLNIYVCIQHECVTFSRGLLPAYCRVHIVTYV